MSVGASLTHPTDNDRAPPGRRTRTVAGAAPTSVVDGAEQIAALACNDVLFARSEPATGRAAPLNQVIDSACGFG